MGGLQGNHPANVKEIAKNIKWVVSIKQADFSIMGI